MLLSPVDALTPTFVRELAAGCRGRTLALFFDTYERTRPFLDGWLLALLEGRYGQLPSEIAITIAGRDPVDSSDWSPYLGVMADVPMRPSMMRKALADLDRALELSPDNAWALLNRGYTYRAMGRYEEALDDFSRALDLYPDDVVAIGSHSLTYRVMGRCEEALADANRTLELMPDNGWCHFIIALVWLCLADEQKAAQHITTAIGRLEQGDTIEALAMLILCCVAQRNTSEARRLTLELIDLPASRYIVRGLAADLAELAEIPGVDRVLVEEMRALAS